MRRRMAITWIAFASFAWAGAAAAAAAAADDGGPGGLTDAQRKAALEEIDGLKVWIDGTAEQYGTIHPAVRTLKARVKALDAALAAGRTPPPLPQPDPAGPPPADVDRTNAESEAEVLRLWFDGMEKGYGKDHPAIAFVRARLKVIDALLAKPGR